MPTPKIRHIIVFLAAFLIVAAAYPPKSPAQQLPAQDVVFLVDCSESATPYLSSIAGIMSRFVSGASAGDSFTCYQFSNTPILIARGRIDSRGVVSQIQKQIPQLRPSGRATNYFPALQKGLADMKASFQSRPANDRLLVVITDGREAGAQSESATFAELLREYSALKAGKDYSFYCFYIGDWAENDLRSYLLSVDAYLVLWPKDKAWLDGLIFSDIRIMNNTISLGEIPDVPTQSTFSISFYPRRAPKRINMIELQIDAPFTKETLDRFFDVRTRRIVCKQEPWTEPIGLETRGFGKGAYTGTFLFQPADPQSTLLFPQIVNFSFSIAESLSVSVPASLSIGPTGFRGDYKEKKIISITPAGANFPGNIDAVSVSSDLKLPEGIQLNLSPTMGEREIIIKVEVSRHQSLSEHAAGKYEGKIRLASRGGWAFTNTEIPISVKVGKQAFNYAPILFYGGIAGACILGVVGILFAFTGFRARVYDYLAQRTRPVGKLIITYDPTRGIVKNINLNKLSEKKRKKELFLGSGEEMDVELPHMSMLDRIFKVSGFKNANGVATVIEAVKGSNEVLVNDKSHTGRVKLRHFDSIKLGAFEFRYEVPKPLGQVVLYFLSGPVWQGWPLSWNMQAEGFRFLNRADLPSREESFVRFYELKAVAFVRDFEGELTKNLLSPKVPRSGHTVGLTFADGEELTGYVFDWKNLGDKFYLIPDSMGENVMFFLIERHTLKSITWIKEDATRARRAQRKFQSLLETMSTESERSV